jgi:hypothetical protein
MIYMRMSRAHFFSSLTNRIESTMSLTPEQLDALEIQTPPKPGRSNRNDNNPIVVRSRYGEHITTTVHNPQDMPPYFDDDHHIIHID